MDFPARKIGDQIPAEDENSITSCLKFTFDIPNFGLLNQIERVIYSPTFSGDPKHGEQWRVQFRENSLTWVDTSLQLVHAGSKEEIEATFQFCVMDPSKKIHLAGGVEKGLFLEGREQPKFQSFLIDTLTNPHVQWLVDGCCRFYVQVWTHRSTKSEPVSVSAEHVVLTEQLKSFLINENFADVVLASGNGRFPASKIILAAQSPVFKAMFLSEMLESKENVVKIEDFSDETIQGFLEFVYTGETESLEENAGELLKISEKYQVKSLKGKCEKILLKNLKVENAVDILVLSHLHSSENLKPKIISFVNRNFNSLRNTDSYERMKKEYPQIFCDLYENSMK